MELDKDSMTKFTERPDEYVLRVRAFDKKIYAEKKGLWTWIKAHTIYRKEYQIGRVAIEVLAVMKREKASIEKAFIRKLHEKVGNWIKKHVKNLEILTDRDVQRLKKSGVKDNSTDAYHLKM